MEIEQQSAPVQQSGSQWREIITTLRKRAAPHINKYFHDPEDREDVLAELILRYLRQCCISEDGRVLPLANGNAFMGNIEHIVIDIDRSINGRKRYPSALIHHPLLEKKIYRRYYMERVTPEAIIDELCSTSAVSRSEVLCILAKLEADLGRKARRATHGARRRNELYRRLPEEMADSVDAVLSPEQNTIAEERRAIMTAALARLPAEDRLIIQYRYLEELKIGEIARLLDLKRYRIAYRIARTRRILQNYFRKRGIAYQDLFN